MLRPNKKKDVFNTTCKHIFMDLFNVNREFKQAQYNFALIGYENRLFFVYNQLNICFYNLLETITKH